MTREEKIINGLKFSYNKGNNSKEEIIKNIHDYFLDEGLDEEIDLSKADVKIAVGDRMDSFNSENTFDLSDIDSAIDLSLSKISEQLKLLNLDVESLRLENLNLFFVFRLNDKNYYTYQRTDYDIMTNLVITKKLY